MIYTITLNPSFDQTVICDNFCVNQLNRVLKSRRDIGGKGINVSKIIKVLGGKSQAHGLLPENGSVDFRKSMIEVGLEQSFIIVKGYTIRTNLKIIDRINHGFTEINESGPEMPPENIDLMVKKLEKKLQTGDSIVLAGNAPPNFSNQTYKKLVKTFQNFGCKVLLDVDGDSLKQSISEAPFFIKPNLFELEQLIGKNFTNLTEIDQATELLLARGIEHILVSLGSRGSFYAGIGVKYRIQPIDVEVQSPVGAGDSQVAAFAYGIDNKLSLEETLKLACAAATSMVQTEGSTSPDLDQIEKLKQKVILEKYQ